MIIEVRQDEVPSIIDARKMYVVVRADLPEGLRAAQAAHAVAEICLGYANSAYRWNSDPDGNYLIVLEVPNERALMEWVNFVAEYSIVNELFREPDLGGAATAFAALPEPGLNGVFSVLPLAFPRKPLTRRQRLNRALRRRHA